MRLASIYFIQILTDESVYAPIRAELTTGTLLVLFLLSGALAYALRPKIDSGLRIEDQPTTLSTRGSWLPLTIGKRRIAPLVGWAGERTNKQEGGGGKGGGKKGKSTVYYEAAWHQLRVGPINRLNKIIQGGDVIWEGPISRWDTPSGSEIEIDGEGTFVIWWGEVSQPINTWLGDAARVGVSSRWPYVASVCWIEKRLGGSAYWPQIEYDIEADCVGSELDESDCDMAVQDANAQDDGVNYAHAVYQLITGDWPHGAGISGTAHVDYGTLEALGVLCELEHTPCSIDARDGATAADVLSDLASDHGFTIFQVGSLLLVHPIRTEATPPAFDDGHLVPPSREQEISHGRSANRVLFSFNDCQRAYTRNQVKIDDDGGATSSERDVTTIDVPTVVDYATAEKVAERKSVQLLAQPTQRRLRMGYTARVLYPGISFSVSSIGYLRCTSVKLSSMSPFVDLVVLDDKYAVDSNAFFSGDTGNDGGTGSPVADLIVAVLEAPYSVSGLELQFMVLRVRGSAAAGPAAIWISSNGTAYTNIGTQPSWVFGGTVTADHDASILTVDEEGPVLSQVGFGDDVLQDLTGDDDSWRTGRQVALVVETGELMFVRKATALGGDSYRLDDCIRARVGTEKQDIQAGYTIIVFDTSSAQVFADAIAASGAGLWVKSQPQGVGLDEITPAYVLLSGLALSPHPALLHRDDQFYDSTGDAVIEWNYKVREGDGNAASEQLAGSAISGVDPVHEGTFFVEVIDPSDDSVVRTSTVDSDTPSLTYTSAERTTDFGVANPTFIVRVTNKLGGRSSPSRSMTVYAI